jgi:4'-phosphopantetheinyl transferase
MWTPPPEPLDLRDDTVDVWRLSLERPTEVVERLARLLTDEERARAARFRFECDQNCYTLTRGVLRRLLGDYLNISSRDIAFATGEHGKPALAPSQQPSQPIEFNVSHSGGYSLFAFSRGRAVGVDVEQMRARKSLELVAKHHFSPKERDALSGVEGGALLQRFYRCWTRKEAYMKATGKGVALGLKSFAVSVDEAPRLLWTDHGDADRWQFVDVSPGDGYAAAVCVEDGGSVEVRGFDVCLREAGPRPQRSQRPSNPSGSPRDLPFDS